jgi:hypothetical protein
MAERVPPGYAALEKFYVPAALVSIGVAKRPPVNPSAACANPAAADSNSAIRFSRGVTRSSNFLSAKVRSFADFLAARLRANSALF